MPTKITDTMILAASSSFSLETVGKVRRILSAAGVNDVELHRLEIEAVREHLDRSRRHAAAAESYLASGPLPDHGCIVDDDGIVTDAGSCPYGCRPRMTRSTVE